MSTLSVTIVTASLVPEANEKFRIWRQEHPGFMAIAGEQAIVVDHIRGTDSGGSVVSKSRYSVVIGDTNAAALVAESDLLLDVLVVDAKAPPDADVEF